MADKTKIIDAVTKYVERFRRNNYPFCQGCNCEIDPDVCHCGIERKNHNPFSEGHNFVPMGCCCGYHRE